MKRTYEFGKDYWYSSDNMIKDIKNNLIGVMIRDKILEKNTEYKIYFTNIGGYINFHKSRIYITELCQ